MASLSCSSYSPSLSKVGLGLRLIYWGGAGETPRTPRERLLKGTRGKSRRKRERDASSPLPLSEPHSLCRRCCCISPLSTLSLFWGELIHCKCPSARSKSRGTARRRIDILISNGPCHARLSHSLSLLHTTLFNQLPDLSRLCMRVNRRCRLEKKLLRPRRGSNKFFSFLFLSLAFHMENKPLFHELNPLLPENSL